MIKLLSPLINYIFIFLAIDCFISFKLLSFVLVDPNINEEYAIRRIEGQEKVKPVSLFQQPVTPAMPAKKPITPMSNSTMIDHVVQNATEIAEPSALFTTASEFTGDDGKSSDTQTVCI